VNVTDPADIVEAAGVTAHCFKITATVPPGVDVVDAVVPGADAGELEHAAPTSSSAAGSRTLHPPKSFITPPVRGIEGSLGDVAKSGEGQRAPT